MTPHDRIVITRKVLAGPGDEQIAVSHNSTGDSEVERFESRDGRCQALFA